MITMKKVMEIFVMCGDYSNGDDKNKTTSMMKITKAIWLLPIVIMIRTAGPNPR